MTLAPTTTALQASAASIYSGSSVSFSATVAQHTTPAISASGVPALGAISTVPTGTVTFLEGTATLGIGVLNASGVASYATSSLAVGSHSVTASYGGDANNAASLSAAVVVTVSVPPAPVAALIPASLSFTALSGATSAAQTATLSNTGNAALTISGISIGGTNASAFAQSNTCGNSLAAGANCVLSLTFAPTAAGSFTATLSVADNASGSPQTVSLSGTSSLPPSFTLNTNTAAQKISAGGTATYTLTVTPQNGAFNSAVSFSASGLPAGAKAAFSPATVTPGASAATTQLTIQTTAPSAASRTTLLPLAAPALALVFLLAIPRKRRRLLALGLLLAASLGALTLSGCGGGFALTNSSTTYTVTVTASGGQVQQTTTVQLTVQ